MYVVSSPKSEFSTDGICPGFSSLAIGFGHSGLVVTTGFYYYE